VLTDDIPYKVTIAGVYCADLLRKLPDAAQKAPMKADQDTLTFSCALVHGNVPAHRSRLGQVALLDSDLTQQMCQSCCVSFSVTILWHVGLCCIQTVIDSYTSCVLTTFNKDDDDDDDDDDEWWLHHPPYSHDQVIIIMFWNLKKRLRG